MVGEITEAYRNGGLLPTKPSGKSERSESSKPRNSPAERVATQAAVPELRDRVEISDEGRQAAKTAGATADKEIPAETRETIEQSWYDGGIQNAISSLDKEES